MVSEHIVKAYDDELQHLNNTIALMGGLAEAQLAAAIEAVMKRDTELAAETIENDDKVDKLEHEIDQFSLRLLALRQPMAEDLRNIIAALKISSDLERIADYATNVAKRGLQLAHVEPVKPLYTIPRMGRLAQAMIKDVLDAYIERAGTETRFPERLTVAIEGRAVTFVNTWLRVGTAARVDPKELDPSGKK